LGDNLMQVIPTQTGTMEPVTSELTPEELCSVLVLSCDKYSDLWKPFWTLFWRYWPDCPFPAYLGTNQEQFHHPRVRILETGADGNWTRMVRTELSALQTPYVLLSLEDFFLQSPVDTVDVLHCLTAIQQLDGVMLRLLPLPGPDTSVTGYPWLGRCSPGRPYRLSTQTAIWRREALLDLLRDGESAWEFEIQGNRRIHNRTDGFYCTWRPVMTYRHHVVERGKWFRQKARKFGAMNIGCDFSRRPIMTWQETLRWRYSKARSLLLQPYVRWRVRREWCAAISAPAIQQPCEHQWSASLQDHRTDVSKSASRVV
jgi:hypothetical protein